MRFTPRVALFGALLFMAGLAFANGPVTGEIQAYLVTVASDGEEEIVETQEAEPGNTMEFQIVFTNNGDEDVSGIEVVDPIPENTRFIADSSSSDVDADFEVSVDGGESFETAPVVRIETQEDGSQKKVIVPESEYTHVRWSANDSLAGEGGQHRFAYRVTVN